MARTGWVWFIAGALTGAGIAWYLTREHYKGTVIATIDHDTEKAAEKGKDLVQEVKDAAEKSEKKAIETRNNIIAKNSYAQYYTDKQAEAAREAIRPKSPEPEPEPEQENPNVAKNDPEIEKEYLRQQEKYGIEYISPEIFGEHPEWETYSLTYYKDGFLVDDMGGMIDEIDSTVGRSFMDHFDDDGMVFVRNHVRQCDYEIMSVNVNFVDVYSRHLYDNSEER